MLKTLARVVTFQNSLTRNIHISAVCRLKQIVVEKKDDKTTVIQGKIIPSPREPYLLKTDEKSSKCPLCQLNLELKHTDVLILSQYINPEGKIFKRFETKLCKDQYKLVKELIYMAQYAGLLPEPPSKEPKKPYRLLNTYYDEKTIRLRYRTLKCETEFRRLKRTLGPLEKARVKPQIGFYYGPQQH